MAVAMRSLPAMRTVVALSTEGMKLLLVGGKADAAGAIATAIATAAEPATMAPAVRPSLVNIIDSPYLLNRCFIENANIYPPRWSAFAGPHGPASCNLVTRWEQPSTTFPQMTRV